VPGFDWQAWQGVVAPAGTPKEIVARLSTELQRIQQTQEFKEQLFKFGMEPFAPHSPNNLPPRLRRSSRDGRRRSRIPAQRSIDAEPVHRRAKCEGRKP